MRNVVLTRVDDRFLHGQVVVSWIPYLKADEVVIIDDELANDDFMQQMIKEAAPDNINVQVLTVDAAIKYLKESDENDSRILILLKNIEYIKMFLEHNINLNKINLGNLGSSTDRKKYTQSVYLSDNETELLKSIRKLVNIEYQMLPKDKPIKFE